MSVTSRQTFLANSRGFELRDTATVTWSFDPTTNRVTADVSVAAGSIADDAVTNAKLANMAQSTIKGRAAGSGTGDPVDLSAAQATAILNTFTSLLQGLVPASGGGTSNFLRADGSFTVPPGTTTGANPTANAGLSAINGSAVTFMRSDAAPAIDQSISPTWSGTHTFSNHVLLTDGTAASPGVSFSADTDNGMYRKGTNILGFAAGGAAVAALTATVFSMETGIQFQAADGSVSAPGVSFFSDTDCGMYHIGTNNIGFAVNGAKVLDVATTGLGVTGTMVATGAISGSNLSSSGGANPSASVGLSAVNGSAITFMRSDAAPALDQAISPTWSGTHIFSNAIKIADGTVGAPGWTFSADTDTGAYRVGANTAYLVAGGAQAIAWDNNTVSHGTRLYLYDVDTASVQQVSVGAAGSGGTGFKLLRIPN